MRVCFICPEYPAGPHGGIGTYTRLTARELVRLGHEVRVIGVYSPSYPAPDYEEDFGVKVFRLRTSGNKYGWIPAWIKQYKIVKGWINDKLIDIVEAPDSRGWYAFWPKLAIPLVLRFHGSQTFIARLTNRKPNKLTCFLESLTYKRADVLCSVSNFNAKTTASIFKIKRSITVIYNGLEFWKLEPQIRKIDHIVYAGTVNTFKGIEDFLDAVVLLAKENIDFVAHIYGKDAILDSRIKASEYIKSLSQSPLLKGKLHYHGNVTREKLFLIYQEAGAAVFPSHVESFGLAPVEAMMCECPVVFTNNTTGYEIIDDGVDAILVPPHNPLMIAEAIKKILKDPDWAFALGKKARENVLRKFNLHLQVNRNLELYENAISKKIKNKI